MFLAIKEMKYAKLRYFLIIGIMLLVSYVVFMLSGLANGLATGHKQAITDWDASTIVLSSDSNKIANASMMTRSDLTRIQAKRKAAVGLLSTSSRLSGHSGKTNVSIFGAQENSFVVPSLIEGHKYSNDHEVIISANLKNDGYSLGDKIKLGNDPHAFKIVGISKSTTYSIQPVIYLNLNAYASLKGTSGELTTAQQPISLVAVKGQSPEATKITTHKSDAKLSKLSVNEFITNLPGYSAEKLTLNTMIYFLFVIVAAVLGIFLYVMTMQKISLFGVLKAQGIKNSYLIQSVVGQSLIVSVIGVVLAFILSVLTSLVLPAAMPFTVNTSEWLLYGAVLIIVSMIGALFSIHSIIKVDPINAIGGE
ncbi:FtsX-like permease family protein [Paucilactobacillus suebicus]|uniref:Putative hemin transport system permease protein HrtB n=1 Tax=Paucilactobacillus suebicus DSM 5007 = KCTC 3549 TaxID=1423807 RepID=A0A0R1VZ36_9LACO|nr:FtsX-like permease family protein [Paucilactobacillus suebicus]KRM10794.1 hypothetical protein FD16_GL001095 [Paucilactobacillus suebicus DSM 5007 = KCTC 3549]